MNSKTTVLLRPTDISLEKENVKGVAKFDEAGKKLHISIINLNPETNCRLCLHYATEFKTEKFEMTGFDGGEYLLSDGTDFGGAVLIAKDINGEIVPILYGAFSKNAPTKEKVLNFTSYDDEAIATENYFEYEKNGNNRLIGGDIEYDGESIHTENDVFGEKVFQKAKEKSEESVAFENEDEPHKKNSTYYEKIRGELDKLFKDHPTENDLTKTVPDSKWVKISYGDDRYYAVGIIFKDKIPKYICYGVPGSFGVKPSEIKNYCSFIPSSVFKPKAKGYWVIFQRAKDGKTIN